jgi:ComF family protein
VLIREGPSRTIAVVNTLARQLVSLIVPPLCAACREPELSGTALCLDCRSRLVSLAGPRCVRCGAPCAHEAADCRECRGRRLAFSCAWAPFAYAGVARQVVSALKSRGTVAVARSMAREIAGRAGDGLIDGTLVPVPAHAVRRRRHGFNQAGSIARALGATTSLPVRDLLTRTGTGVPQVGLERGERLANARASIQSRSRTRGPGRVVLVDDVYTTGATLDACARALTAAGTEEIVAVTFARAIRG